MARHTDKIRAQLRKAHGQQPRRLRRVEHERNAARTAQGRNFFDRQDIPEHVGHVRADHGACARRDGAVKRGNRIRRVKQPPSGDDDLCAKMVQRPQDRVMLKTGNNRTSARLYERFDRQIQRMGRIHGEYDLLRLRVKQRPCQTAAVIDRVGCAHGGRMPAAPGCRHAAHGALHRKGNSGRLLERGGSGVQVDHSCAFSRKPFGWTR